MKVMSYEYEFKEYIRDEILSNINHMNILDDALEELDHVYAQAAEYKEYRADTEKLYNALKAKGEKEILKYKVVADEYEVKAKALDRIRKILDEITNDEKSLMDARNYEFDAGKMSAYENIKILMYDYKYIYKKYESGEPNELRE